MDATTVVDRVVIPAGATKADVQSLYKVLTSGAGNGTLRQHLSQRV